jgi:hypothetical protein
MCTGSQKQQQQQHQHKVSYPMHLDDTDDGVDSNCYTPTPLHSPHPYIASNQASCPTTQLRALLQDPTDSTPPDSSC